jgi:D-amino-acid dehydrogenase
MTPSGIPVIGPTSIEGLFLNAGHGSLGYTFAAGSAQRIANQIGGPS